MPTDNTNPTRGKTAPINGSTPEAKIETQLSSDQVINPVSSSQQEEQTAPSKSLSCDEMYNASLAYFSAQNEGEEPTAEASEQGPRPDDCWREKVQWKGVPKLFDTSKAREPRRFFATMAGRPALPLTGIIAFNGKIKQGKSTAISALLRTLIKGTPFGTLVPTEHRPKRVLAFDTEMDDDDLYTRTLAMEEVLGSLKNNYGVVSLMDSSSKSEKIEMIKHFADVCNPDIIVIDKVTDLVADFNNQVECDKVMSLLKEIAKTRSVWITIHQNKAADNSLMKGHLGSFVGEGATESYSVKRKGNIFSVVPVFSRKSNVIEGETEGFQFSLNAEGEIISAAPILERNKAEMRSQWIKNMRSIFGNDEALKSSEIKRRIMAKENLKDRAAATKIGEAAACEAIVKEDPKNHFSLYRIAEDAAPAAMASPADFRQEGHGTQLDWNIEPPAKYGTPPEDISAPPEMYGATPEDLPFPPGAISAPPEMYGPTPDWQDAPPEDYYATRENKKAKR